jgi:hypothetical protein
LKLNDLRQVNLGAGRPDANMTDAQWQQYFSLMKLMTSQGKTKRMRSEFAKFTVNGHAEDSGYTGDTSYVNYCKFINGVLSTIRGSSTELPQHDYCFFIYHITDLLRFEHDGLRTMWRPEYECFEVWLEK